VHRVVNWLPLWLILWMALVAENVGSVAPIEVRHLVELSAGALVLTSVFESPARMPSNSLRLFGC